jgi:regulation of enolase protein 1 (concanavalin A-like superfamily)
MRAPLVVLLCVSATAMACGNGGGITSTGTVASSSSVGSGGAQSSVASGGSGGSGGMQGGGAAGSPPCAKLSDDFEDPSSLACWTEDHTVEGTVLDVDLRSPGRLAIVPALGAWFDDDVSVFLFKDVTGDFVVETHVAAFDSENLYLPPPDTATYSTAGLLVRDPAGLGTAAPADDENWIMYDVGYQDTVVGTMFKSTDNSDSQRHILEAHHAGRLRICRVGDEYRMLRLLDDEDIWTLAHSEVRGDLPSSLQVGVVANAYTEPTIEARFAYVHFATVASIDECDDALDLR